MGKQFYLLNNIPLCMYILYTAPDFIVSLTYFTHHPDRVNLIYVIAKRYQKKNNSIKLSIFAMLKNHNKFNLKYGVLS